MIQQVEDLGSEIWISNLRSKEEVTQLCKRKKDYEEHDGETSNIFGTLEELTGN